MFNILSISSQLLCCDDVDGFESISICSLIFSKIYLIRLKERGSILGWQNGFVSLAFSVIVEILLSFNMTRA